MRTLVPAALLLLTSSLPLTARAEDCGNVTAEGVCQDAKTLVYCDRGVLQVMRCPTGELCANDQERFNGAAGCIATRYAGCGAVPEQGLCAGQTLLYCANGRIEELECPAGTRCQAVDGEDYDCVASPGDADATDAGGSAGSEDDTDAEDTPVEPGQDADAVDETTPVASTNNAPLPTVQKGGAGPASDYDASGTTCQGGTLSWLGALAFAVLRMRARRAR